jgi:predicted transglutaminase-like cysteine proteinase
MATGGKTSQPIGHHEFCLSHAAECAVKTANPGRVRLTPDRWNTLVAVNNEVNTDIRPVTDEEIFGKPEVWAYPTDRGDCEDFVLLKRRDLLSKGWPASALLITVVRQMNGDGHAVLTVRSDRGDLILDNLVPQIKVWSQTNYRFVKRQSEFDASQWVAIDDARTPMVGSLKR